MEPNDKRPQDITPGRPMPRVSAQPIARRPMMSDFAPRPRPASPTPTHSPQPSVHSTPSAPQPAVVAPRPQSNVLQPVAINTLLSPPPRPSEEAEPDLKSDEALLPAASDSKPQKEQNQTGHAGLVGLGVFIILTALLLSPFLPGKILENFPGSSDSFSTGDQSIACADNPGPQVMDQKYNSKSGFPITYSYSTTSTIRATCDGKAQVVTGGHTSQFNPLGAVINVAISLVVAVIVAKIWRKIFSKKS